MAEKTLRPGSIWRLRVDIVSARILLWFAGAGRTGEPNPGAHLYLADRYSWLAERYRQRREIQKSERFAVKASWHFSAAGRDDPPAAVAVAMPIPTSPVNTHAVARNVDAADPDDAA